MKVEDLVEQLSGVCPYEKVCAAIGRVYIEFPRFLLDKKYLVWIRDIFFYNKCSLETALLDYLDDIIKYEKEFDFELSSENYNFVLSKGRKNKAYLFLSDDDILVLAKCLRNRGFVVQPLPLDADEVTEK